MSQPRSDKPGAPSHRLAVPPDLAGLAEVRRWLGQVAGDASLSESRAFDLKVVGSEAVANAIEHAGSAVELEAWLLPDRLIVEVTSEGAFQPGLVKDDAQRRRGLGLPLMVSLADQVHVARGPGDTTRVTFTFFREVPTEAPLAAAGLSEGLGGSQPLSTGEISPPPWAVWLLLPAFAVAVAILAVVRLRGVYNPEGLFTAANIILVTLLSIFVSFLAARGYLLARSEAVLLTGCGALALGLGALLSAVQAGGPGNGIPAVYNTAALLSGLCHLGAALWARSARPLRTSSRPRFLASAYVAVVLLLAVLIVLVRGGVWPLHFLQGTGPTLFGSVVARTSAVLFALAAMVLLLAPGKREAGLRRWYAIGLGLIAIGLTGVSLQVALGDVLNWTSRASQYLGSVAIFVGMVLAGSKAGAWTVSLESALKESQTRYKNLVDLSPDGILLHSQGECVFVNPAAARLLGARSADEVIGKEVMTLIHPDHRGAFAVWTDQTYGGAITPSREARLLRLDGVEMDVEVSGTKVVLGGRPTIQLVLRDVTERKKAEEALRRSESTLRGIQDATQESIWLFDSDGVVLAVNATAIQRMGRTAEEIVGRHIRDLLTPGLAETRFERLRQVAESGRPVEFEDEWAGRVFLHTFCPVSVDDGPVERIVSFSRDITERKRWEVVLAKSEERLGLALESARVTAYEVDLEQRYVWVHNPHPSLGAEDLTGHASSDLFPSSEIHRVVALRRQVMDTGEPARQEFTLPLFGEMRTYDYSVAPARDKAGRLTGAIVTAVDVTERKKAEEALKESEERLRTVLENSQDGINMLDLATGRYLFLNDAQVALTGFTAEELEGISAEEALERVHPDDREISLSQQQRAAAGEDTDEPVEYRWKVKSGEYRWFSDRRKLVRDKAGRVVALVGISRDITDRKRVEEDLLSTLERQALAQRATKTGFWDWDIKTGGLSWSPELFELLGLDPEIEPTFDLWLSTIHPDDRERAMQKLDRSLAERVSLENEYRVCLADGQEIWIGALGDTSYTADGEPVRLCGICMDITDRKKAEAERELMLVKERELAAGAYARSLLEASVDPLVTISPKGKITDVNEATVKITGRARDRLIGTDFSDYFTDPKSARRGYREVFAKGSVTDYPLTIRDSDGKLTDVLYNASVYRDGNGEVAGVFAAARDITAIRELEEQRAIAHSLQEALLDIPHELPGMRLGHLYRSATKEALVGGDFYDVFLVKHGRIAVLIGDVSGHGVEAARIATLVKDVANAFTRQSPRPSLVLRQTNELLIERDTPGFVTLFLGVIDPAAGTITYCSAGHPNAMLRARGGAVTLLAASSAPLGIFDSYTWKEDKATFREGDLLLLYTDGMIEARRERELFGAERLAETLERWADTSPQGLPGAMLADVLDFSGGELADDAAILALELTRVSSPAVRSRV